MLSRKIIQSLAGTMMTSTRRIQQSSTKQGNYCWKNSRCFSDFRFSHPHGHVRRQTQLQAEREYDSDLVVVLDLDECLIHSQFLGGRGSSYAHQVLRCDDHTPSEVGSSSVDAFEVYLENGEHVRVNKRPHLHDFLRNVSDKYETHVLTAAMQVYAMPILNILDPDDTIFSSCRFRDSCRIDMDMNAHVKNLDFAWGGDQIKRTVLVDNNPLSFLDNPDNGILVSNFYDDPNDTTLLAVIDLLGELDSEKDVRPLLQSRFGVKRFLEKIRRHQRSPREHQQEEEEEVLVAAAAG